MAVSKFVKLKPCPFCGWKLHKRRKRWWTVFSHGEAPVHHYREYWGTHAPGCFLYRTQVDERQVAGWNRRAK